MRSPSACGQRSRRCAYRGWTTMACSASRQASASHRRRMATRTRSSPMRTRRSTPPSGAARTARFRHKPRTWSGASRLKAMGLLDDAIRDHLDLKRRRGADPGEVERAEREALGPVRRAPVEPADGELTLGPPALEDAYVGDEQAPEHVEWDEHFEAATELHAVPDPEHLSPAPFDDES